MIAAAFDAFLPDLDGVVYLGLRLLPGVRETLKELRRMGKEIRFITNGPVPHRRDLVEGWRPAWARSSPPVTPPPATSRRGSRPGRGTTSARELGEAGLLPVREGPAEAVVAGC